MSNNWKVAILVLIGSTGAFSQETSATTSANAGEKLNAKNSFKNIAEVKELPAPVQTYKQSNIQTNSPNLKSVYISLGLGTGDTKYGGLDSDFDQQAERAFGSHSILVLDAGIYVPIENYRLLVGGAFNFISDSYGDSDGKHFDINTTLLGLSVLHYFGDNPLKGAYLRTDIGMAWQDVDVNYSDSGDASTEQSFESDVGYGYIVGAGYNFNPWNMALKLEINLQSRITEDDDDDMVSHATTFNLGVLF